MKRYAVAMVWTQPAAPMPTLEIVEATSDREAAEKAAEVYERKTDWPTWEMEMPDETDPAGFFLSGPDILISTKEID